MKRGMEQLVLSAGVLHLFPSERRLEAKLSAAEQKNQAAEDETLRKENAIRLAIELLQRSETADGRATRSFRLGEFVPFCAVRRQGGGGGKQFENVASPEEVARDHPR